MAELPKCPNVVKGQCARSDLVLGGENEACYQFICRTCKLFWVWTKPKEKAAAGYRNQVEKLDKATESDREAARRPRVFGAPRGGWTT